MNENPKNIIFDLDGTIADSFDVFVQAIETVTKRHDNITDEEINYLKTLTVMQIVNKLGIKKWQLPGLIIRGKREMHRNMAKVKPFQDMPGIIKKLSGNYNLFILSTNSKQNIDYFLNKYALESYFKNVYADIGLLSKAKSLKKLCVIEELKISESVYIGDEIRDYLASKKVKINFIAVGWGYSDADTLRSYKPNALVMKPSELLKIGELV